MLHEPQNSCFLISWPCSLVFFPVCTLAGSCFLTTWSNPLLSPCIKLDLPPNQAQPIPYQWSIHQYCNTHLPPPTCCSGYRFKSSSPIDLLSSLAVYLQEPCLRPHRCLKQPNLSLWIWHIHEKMLQNLKQPKKTQSCLSEKEFVKT